MTYSNLFPTTTHAEKPIDWLIDSMSSGIETTIAVDAATQPLFNYDVNELLKYFNECKDEFVYKSSAINNMLTNWKDKEISRTVGINFVMKETASLFKFSLNYDVQILDDSMDTNATADALKVNWQSLARAQLSQDSYLYISRLANKKDGWRGTGSCSMNAQSLSVFLKLWENIARIVQEPEYILLPNGNLQIEWFKDSNNFIDLEFRPDESIIFGMFKEKTVLEGVASAPEITEMLRLFDFILINKNNSIKEKRVKTH